MSLAAGHPVEQAMEMAEFVRQKVWDPDWSQVLVFLAGELGREDPWGGDPEKARQLVELIWSPEVEDDYFHHRLCLAAECLAEMAPSVRDREQVNQVSKTLWLWVKELSGKQGGEVDWIRELGHVERGVQAVWELGGQVEGENVRERLVARLGQSDQTAFELLDPLEPVLGLDEDFLEALVEVLLGRLGDKLKWVRALAARALGALGPAVAEKAGVVEGLVERLGDEQWLVRQAAVEALGALGPAVMEKPGVVKGLVERLEDRDTLVCRAAAEVLKSMGRAVAGNESGLRDLLRRVELPDQSRYALEVLTGVDRAGYRIFVTPGGVRAYAIEELVAGSRERVESPIKKAKGRYQRAGKSLKKRRSGRQ